jgi:hypothetical protein
LHQERTRGERLADAIATHVGSWRFLIIQTIAVILSIAINVIAAASGWDPTVRAAQLALQRPGRLHRRGIGSVAESLGQARPDDRYLDFTNNEKGEQLVEPLLSEGPNRSPGVRR